LKCLDKLVKEVRYSVYSLRRNRSGCRSSGDLFRAPLEQFGSPGDKEFVQHFSSMDSARATIRALANIAAVRRRMCDAIESAAKAPQKAILLMTAAWIRPCQQVPARGPHRPAREHPAL